MSSPARGSRTPRREPDTPSRRSSRRTPSGAQTPGRDEDPSSTPTRSHRTPAKRKQTPNKSDGVDGTPMRWGAPRNEEGSDIPATSPAQHIIPTSPAARKFESICGFVY